MKLAPIVLFVYARPLETQKTLNALSENYLASDSQLFIYSDGPKDESTEIRIKEVRKIIRSFNGKFSAIEIVERDENLGLANSVISGVTEVINLFGKVIVLEDDLISSRNFLNFVNQSLNKYEEIEKVFSVTGYTYRIKIPNGYKFDNYFTGRCESLGWGTWKDRWNKADWELKNFKTFLMNKSEVKKLHETSGDLLRMILRQQLGKLDSWAARWCFTHFINNGVCSYPIKSKIMHIGAGDLATHIKKENNLIDTDLDSGDNMNFNLSDDIFFEKLILEQYHNFFKQSIIKKIKTNCLKMEYLLKKQKTSY